MSASQQHGKTWENNIIGVFGVTSNIPHTSIYDVPREHNSLTSENVSVKTYRDGGEVCMGDALRVFDRGDDVLDVWVAYSQKDSEKHLKEVCEIRLPHDALWGSITRDEVLSLVAMTKDRSIPMPTVHAEKKRLNAKSGLIQFRPKRDSKNQQRLQCALPKKNALECIERFSVSRSLEGILRGVQLVLQIASTKRIRNKRG